MNQSTSICICYLGVVVFVDTVFSLFIVCVGEIDLYSLHVLVSTFANIISSHVSIDEIGVIVR